jgi:hypothetical protein
MLIAMGSFKGSPGVTTAALALAVAWPDEDRMLIEADPDGGDLAVRFSLTEEPGLSTWAAARRRDSAARIDEHTQALPGGLPIVVAPVGPDSASAALRVLRGRLPDDRTLILDCGRLAIDSPALPLFRAADIAVLVMHPELTDIARAEERLKTFASSMPRLRLRLTGGGPYKAPEVAHTLHLGVAGAFPYDPRSAALLAGHVPPLPGRGRDMRSLPILRAATTLAETLAATRPAQSTPPTETPQIEHVNGHTTLTTPEVRS